MAATRAAAAATAAQQEAEAERHAERQARRPSSAPRNTTVVIDPGGAVKPKTPAELSEASKRDRERYGDRSVGELNDGNLAELASRGKVTFAGSAPPAPRPKGLPTRTTRSPPPPPPRRPPPQPQGMGRDGADEASCDEACWRRRAYELREAWSRSVEEIDDLEQEVADLRWRFYAEDDPWVRDSQVKPAWDRALDALRHARDESDRYRERIDELMEEGRRAGALPGWLREGIELEPKTTGDDTTTDTAEPIEPPVLEDDAVEPDQQ